jgi:hypothetical protein
LGGACYCDDAGRSRSRAQGQRLGWPRIGAKVERRIREVKGDRGILKIAADLGAGSGTLQRVKAAASRSA